MREWLLGQENRVFCWGTSQQPIGAFRPSKVLRLSVDRCRCGKPISGELRCAVRWALLACVALLYFAAGGSLFHQHTTGPDNACHICQALHMPALAAARLDFSSTPQIITWFFFGTRGAPAQAIRFRCIAPAALLPPL